MTTHPLNFFVPIRQDAEALKKLQELKDTFAKVDQDLIEAAARKSRIIHFLRVLVLDDKYLVVLTEYEGGHKEYAEFFRKELNELFKKIFEMADIEVDWNDVNNEPAFYAAASKFQIRSLGNSIYDEMGPDDKPAGYLFSAYKNRSVEDILKKIS